MVKVSRYDVMSRVLLLVTSPALKGKLLYLIDSPLRHRGRFTLQCRPWSFVWKINFPHCKSVFFFFLNSLDFLHILCFPEGSEKTHFSHSSCSAQTERNKTFHEMLKQRLRKLLWTGQPVIAPTSPSPRWKRAPIETVLTFRFSLFLNENRLRWNHKRQKHCFILQLV